MSVIRGEDMNGGNKPPKDEPSGDAPSVIVDVAVQDPQWDDLPFNPADYAEIAVRETLFCAEWKYKGNEVSVVLANDSLVHTLNRTYRQKDKPTNVLSFPTEETANNVPIGDVVLAFETLENEAATQFKNFRDHFLHLVVHGTLHLLGYDHETDEDAHHMEDMEIWILRRLGVVNPYA